MRKVSRNASAEDLGVCTECTIPADRGPGVRRRNENHRKGQTKKLED